MQRNRDIPALTGLRGIAALWVFVYHAKSQLPALAPAGAAGYLGVDLFFVLSGFVLALNYADQGAHQSVRTWGGFLWKRLARIYPVHVAALGLVLIAALCIRTLLPDIPSRRLTAEGLLQSLALVHAWQMPVPRTWNFVSWSISCEWAAYIAFPLIALIAAQVRSRIGGVTIIVLLFAVLHVIADHPKSGSPVDYGMLRIAIEFPAGVLLYRLYSQGGEHSRTWDFIALSALVTIIGGGNLMAIRMGWDAAPFPWMPILACVIVYALACARGPVSSFLSRPAWQHAGHISYSFYMVHAIILGMAAAPLRQMGIARNTWAMSAAICVAFALSCLTAHAFYRFIEQPMRARMLAFQLRGYRLRERDHALAQLSQNT